MTWCGGSGGRKRSIPELCFQHCRSGSVCSLCPVFVGRIGLKTSVHCCPPLMKFSAKCQRICPNFDSVLSLVSRVMFAGLHAGCT